LHAISGLALCSWICLAVWIPSADGQVFLLLDTARIPLLAGPGGDCGVPPRFTFKKNLDYSLTSSLVSFINGSGPGNKGQVILQHGLKYSWIIERKEHLTFGNSFSHRLGIQYFFDSISRICPDETIFRTRLEYKFGKWTRFSLDSELNTRLLNNWDLVTTDSNTTRLVLSSSFLTPLIWNLAGGFSFLMPETGSIMLGITGGRLTVIRDTSVFTGQQVNSYYGVKRGAGHLFEYGVSLRLQADRTFWKVLRWNCDLLLFKGYDKPADLNLKNLFEVRLASFIVISVQTRLLYEEDISRQLQVENLFSAGFTLKR
jgi:hypothetical protein